MINGSKILDHPIRWAMVGGGKGSQIGYIHRSAALRDNSFQLVAGAFDIDPARGMEFAAELDVAPDRCYPDYKTMFEAEAKRADGIEAVSIATPNGMHYTVCKAALEAGCTWSVRSRCASPPPKPRNLSPLPGQRTVLSA